MMYLLIKPLFAEITLALGAMLLLMISVFIKDKALLVTRLSSMILLISAAILVFLDPDVNNISNFSYFFASNEFIILAKIIIILSGSFILSLYLVTEKIEKEFPILILFSITGLLLLVACNDFLSLYVSIELSSLCLYVLASYDHKNIKSTEAGIKYFILGSVASGLMLYGISLIYGFSSTTNFIDLLSIMKSDNHGNLGLLVGFILVIIGLCFKISAAPFHMWTPDVYQGSPTIVTAFFSVVPKIAVILLFTRLMINPFGDWAFKWQQIIIAISFLSMFIGALGALKQTSIKRLLAYSSIGHVGYIMAALATNDILGIKAIISYTIIYAIMVIGIFSCIIRMNIDNLSSFAGLSKTQPFLAFMMSIILFSMAAIPPFAGFFAKFYVLFALIHAKMMPLAIATIIASVIAAYYYLKIIKIIYFDSPDLDYSVGKLQIYPNCNALLLAILSMVFIVSYMIFADGFLKLVTIAAESLR